MNKEEYLEKYQKVLYRTLKNALNKIKFLTLIY